MKKLFLHSLFFISILALFSCSNNKCSHCLIKDSQGAVIKDYDEKCGTSKDVNDYEESAKEDAAQYGGTFGCTSS